MFILTDSIRYGIKLALTLNHDAETSVTERLTFLKSVALARQELVTIASLFGSVKDS